MCHSPTASEVRIQTQRLRPARHPEKEKNKGRCGRRTKNPHLAGLASK